MSNFEGHTCHDRCTHPECVARVRKELREAAKRLCDAVCANDYQEGSDEAYIEMMDAQLALNRILAAVRQGEEKQVKDLVTTTADYDKPMGVSQEQLRDVYRCGWAQARLTNGEPINEKEMDDDIEQALDSQDNKTFVWFCPRCLKTVPSTEVETLKIHSPVEGGCGLRVFERELRKQS